MDIRSITRRIPPVTLNLLIINVIIFAALNLLPETAVNKLMNICALHYFTSDKFNPIQVVTYMFMHRDFMHLFFNMFALFMFGVIIERTLSSKKFLFYYFVCGVGAALVQLGVFAIMISHYANYLPVGVTIEEILNIPVPDGYMLNTGDFYIDAVWSLVNTPVIGASGAVYGILLAFGYFYPRQKIYLYFAVPIQARWVVIGYALLELLQGVGNNAGDNVAHFAHLGGMIFGLILLIYWKKKGYFNNNWYR